MNATSSVNVRFFGGRGWGLSEHMDIWGDLPEETCRDLARLVETVFNRNVVQKYPFRVSWDIFLGEMRAEIRCMSGHAVEAVDEAFSQVDWENLHGPDSEYDMLREQAKDFVWEALMGNSSPVAAEVQAIMEGVEIT